MDLTTRLATARTAVLVAEVPGWAATRCAVEREVRTRGWRLAGSPADADVLVVCGRPGPRLAAAVDHVWAQLPGPRARVQVHGPADVPPALDAALADLADAPAQRRDAADRPAEPAPGSLATDLPAPDGDAARDEDADRTPGFDDPGPAPDPDDGTDDGTDPDDGTDMSGMDMPMPGGVPLAGGGDDDQLPDPDRLDLDVLHVPLGPVLPCWPAGLLVHTTLQGDLVVAARAEVLEPAGAPPAGDGVHGTPAGRWDAVAALLALAGDADGAAAAARLRDALLAGADAAAEEARLGRRVRRSRLLHWSLRGVGELDGADAADRLAHWAGAGEQLVPITLEQVAALVTGVDLATARLVVASLDLDTSDRTRVPVPAP